MADDDLSAELHRIGAELRTFGPSHEDTARLLAAVEAVLELHQPGRVAILGSLCERHESHRHFSITRTEADNVRACPDCAATVYASCTGCGPGVNVDACPHRLVITRELSGGKGNGDEA